ncbi:MAG: murein L,D-transpeptidase YcbB/YkuD [Psychromonas sp.]|jgi:murein L,D-transpeptidase YcbB/YkuD|uniref:L,D-transpeptidase family protein n=1 Tax=Psychromonas sp. TaxID=1884585 RepID=UPI0039E5007F
MNLLRWWKTALLLSLLWQIVTVPLRADLFNPNQVNTFNLKYPSLMAAIYQQHPDKQFWTDSVLRNEFEKQISLIVLANISDGLLHNYQRLIKASANKDWQHYELIASDMLLFYLSYSEQISATGNSWLFGGGIKKTDAPSQHSIDNFFNAYSAQMRLLYLQALSPISAQQTALYNNLLQLKNTPIQNFTTEKLTEFSKIGDRLEQKNLLLSRLEISGELSSKSKQALELENNQLYSPALGNIIRAFQVRHGLRADAVIGAKTRYWLNISRQERVRLMALNILRQQLSAIETSNKILVNIPNYKMEYWEADQKVFESKIIVGQTKRKTPLFSANLDTIVFNPSWNVPTSIMRKDILPKALSNPDYLTQNRYQIIENWHSKNEISADKIDWASMTVNNFPYKLRQKSGRSNALGLYKFNTPNKNAIYLHDTPARYLFEKQDRAFSSGCIRVQKAQQFAQLLIDKSGYSSRDYELHRDSTETSMLSLKKKIKVYIIYETVWVDKFGSTQFRNDIYQYDKQRIL